MDFRLAKINSSLFFFTNYWIE